jgi:protocatechuate 3,4-dioxygenase beta subunit
VLADSGIVRHYIRRSFGSSRTPATGVPLRVNLTVTDASDDYKPLSGVAVYAWHCDRLGRYSMYSSGVTDENYLRGIVRTDSDGLAWFRTIFPACYSGRWPHIHFEVYSSVANAISNGPIVKTSQIALPAAACRKVYATSRYSGSSSNLARTSLASDNVFGNDEAIHQLATVTGSVKEGFVANLTVGV